MTTEEKLQHFYDASIESAQKEAQHLQMEHKESLDKMFQEHKQAREQEINQRIHTESRKLKREINKTVSAKQLEYRRILSAKTEEIKNMIFCEVEKKLNDFKNSPEYVEYLISHIQDALDFAEHDEIIIYLDASDEKYLDELTKHFGFTPTISKESWMGGMRAVIRSKNFLIDNSFLSLLKDA